MHVSKTQKAESGPLESPASAELTDTDLDKVSGGFIGSYINPPAKTGSATGTIDGVKGESKDAKHGGNTEILS